jgi:hypothetical protein
MDRLRRLLANCLVWLAAICVPLGPTWVSACGCRTTSPESTVAAAGVPAGCRGPGGCCSARKAQRGSCCRESTDAEFRSGVKATSGCHCKGSDAQPTSDPIATPDDRSADSEQLTQPSLVATASCCAGSERESGCCHGMAASRVSSGIERCILFCRFTL